MNSTNPLSTRSIDALDRANREVYASSQWIDLGWRKGYNRFELRNVSHLDTLISIITITLKTVHNKSTKIQNSVNEHNSYIIDNIIGL